MTPDPPTCWYCPCGDVCAWETPPAWHRDRRTGDPCKENWERAIVLPADTVRTGWVNEGHLNAFRTGYFLPVMYDEGGSAAIRVIVAPAPKAADR